MNTYVKSRIFWLQILILGLLLAGLVGLGFYAADKHVAAQKRIDQAEPRYARLLGLISRREDVGSYTAKTQEAVARLAFPASQDAAQTGNEAQQRIRSIFADSKLDIGSIQVLPVKEGTHFDRITVQLRVEGDLLGIQNALTLMATQNPTIGLETWSVQTIGAVRPASNPRLGAQFNFFVLRGRS